MPYNFFQNKDCEYFPCHKTSCSEKFSCLFCYCPLYPYADCGGRYEWIGNHIKDCSNCLIPHSNYDYIISKLREVYKYE